MRIDWAISRMRRLFCIWDGKLDRADKNYVLRRIRDKEPDLFYMIAREERWVTSAAAGKGER